MIGDGDELGELDESGCGIGDEAGVMEAPRGGGGGEEEEVIDLLSVKISNDSFVAGPMISVTFSDWPEFVAVEDVSSVFAVDVIIRVTTSS